MLIFSSFNLTAAQMNSLISHRGGLDPNNYLLNGKNTSPDLSTGQHAQWTVTAGFKYLFRIINSAAQNSWVMHFDNHTMTVISSDFVPIVPYTTDWLKIGTGQRYDVIITADQPIGNYFFRAVTQNLCPSSTVNNGLGAANGILSYACGNTTLLPTSSFGNVTVADFDICEDEPITSLVPWVARTAGSSDLFASSTQTLPAGNVTLVATSDEGNVFRWFLNGNGFINVNWTQPTLESLAQNNSAAVSNAIFLPQTSVQWVYFVIQNVLPVGHPIHLHGHDFSLLGTGLGTFTTDQTLSLNFNNPPRRDTAMLQASGYTVIGFETDNPGAWLMHCHIVWHVDGGLALQFIERQDKIPAVRWTQNAAFEDQCDAYEAFQATGEGIKFSGESGLKKRWFEQESSVVRRSERSEKRYLGNHAPRALGDGYKPRHVARR
jgi:L-ascorbate oxidase